MRPHLVRWSKDYAGGGLVVIEVNSGKRDAIDDLKKGVEKAGVAFPVMRDNGGKNGETYGVRTYPAGYLIGADAAVAWEGLAKANLDEIEKRIKAEIEKVKK